jgi:hypothetical protein
MPQQQILAKCAFVASESLVTAGRTPILGLVDDIEILSEVLLKSLPFKI